MYKDRILKLLRASKSGFLSGEELAAKLGISRTMVWKHIKALEREGIGIEALPSQGYRITGEPDLLRLHDIRQGLGTRLIGREMHLSAATASTNTLAMEMAAKGAPAGTVVIAETQTGGKGRLGRKWISPRGSLYLSIILRPEIPTHKAPLVTLMGAVAAASAIRTAVGAEAAIKWPNDILIDGKKTGGLLSEMSAEADRIRHLVLGIGINVNAALDELPADIRAVTTSIAEAAGRAIDRTALLRQLLRDMEKRYRLLLEDEAALLAEWVSLNVTIGRRVAVSGLRETFEGLAQGIDPEGRLVIRTADGQLRPVAAGDVTILKK